MTSIMIDHARAGLDHKQSPPLEARILNPSAIGTLALHYEKRPPQVLRQLQ